MSSHPSDERLRAFATGELEPHEFAQIELHLEHCKDCGDRFDQVDLAAHPLVELLRHPLAAELTLASGELSNSPCLTPRMFGHYELIEEIGRGGMGVVYRAKDLRLSREVAVKLIVPQRSASAADKQRFRREAAAAARLQHANIVQVFEFGEQDGTLYCALEFVSRGNLAERLKQELPSSDEAARLVATLADAAEYAHRRRIVHRDLKPANVLFAEDDTPKIADFGLAKVLDDEVAQTQSGDLLGSPSYMAPEQASGVVAAVGPCTDIHALGIILYESLAGHSPFRGKDILETLELVKNWDPPVPARQQHTIDRDLATICLKCLRKEPQERYASAALVAEDLRRFLARVPVNARQPSWHERTVKAIRRNPAVAFLLFTIVIILASSALTLGIALRQSLAQNESLGRKSFALQLQQAQAVLEVNPQQAQRLLDDPTLCPVELRDFTWRLLQARSNLQQATWPNGAPVTALAVAPAGNVIATGDDRGTVRLWRDTGRNTQELVHHREPITDLCFNVTGTVLAVACQDGEVTLWNLSQEDPPICLRIPEVRANGVAISPCGTKVLTAYSDGVVRIWTSSDGKLLHELRHHSDSVLRVDFNSDGSLLASSSRDGELVIWKSDDWSQQNSWRLNAGFVTALTFHPQDAAFIAFATSKRTVQTWALKSDEKTELPTAGRDFAGTISGIAMSSNGSRLAAASYDGYVHIWDVPSKRSLVNLGNHNCEIFGVGFISNERLLVGTKAGNLILWNEPKGLEPHVLTTVEEGITGLGYAQHGMAIVASSYDGHVRAWDRRTELQSTDHVHSGDWATLLCVAEEQSLWSADGKLWLGSFNGGKQLEVREVSGQPILPRALLQLDKSTAIVSDAASVRKIDLRDGRIIWETDVADIRLLATDHQCKTLAMADSKQGWWLGSTTTGNGSWRRHHADICSIAVDPAGSCIALGNSLGVTAVVTTADTSRSLLNGHTGAVQAIEYSPDGRVMATAGNDGEICLWDPKIGSLRGRLSSRSAVRHLIFSADSGELLVCNAHGEIQIWNASESD